MPILPPASTLPIRRSPVDFNSILVLVLLVTSPANGNGSNSISEDNSNHYWNYHFFGIGIVHLGTILGAIVCAYVALFPGSVFWNFGPSQSQRGRPKKVPKRSVANRPGTRSPGE